MNKIYAVIAALLIVACQSTPTVGTPSPVPKTTYPVAPAPAPEPMASKFDQKLSEAKNFIVGKSNLRQDYLVLIDFSMNSSKARFYLVTLATGKIETFHVAHGKASDPDFDGFATTFSNESGSNKSALGFYRTAETYVGSHGLSLKLDGLSSTNSNARSRAIVVHAADYVYEKNQKAGRSLGCPALAPEVAKRLVPLLKNGVLIFAFN